MDVVQAIWLSSMTGAGLFFSAGLLARAAATRRPAAEGRAEEHVTSLTLAGERAAREAAEARAAAAALAAERDAAVGARARDQQEIARLSQLVQERERDRQEIARLSQIVHQQKQDQREITRLTELVDRQQTEAIELRALASTKGVDVKALRDEIGRLRAKVMEKSGGIEQMKPNAAGAEAELTHARRAIGAMEAELARVRSELVGARIALSKAEAQAAEAGRLREENGALRGDRAAADRRRGEGHAFEASLAQLEARGFARRPPAAPRPPPPPASSERLEAALERHLDALVRRSPGTCAAILTDVGGLLIAASAGVEKRDELGAAASLLSSTADRVRMLLPIDDPAWVEIADTNSVVYRARWLRAGDDAFLISTLGIAPEGAGALGDDERALVSRLAGSS